MKRTTSSYARVRRLSVAEAKAHLSAVLRETSDQPTLIHNRGRDVAVLLPVAEYERLCEGQAPTPAARFLEQVAALRQRFGGGADDFRPARARLRAQRVRFGGKS